MMSALKINASSYLAGMSDGARKPVLHTRIFATPGSLADDGKRPSQQEKAARCQRGLDMANVECDELRELVVSLQLENRQLQSDASPCEGLTASEWHGYSVDLQKGHAKLAKELLEKNAESDELRLLNQGLEKAHRTAVEVLEALQLSHTAVLLDRDRLVSAFGSKTHESHYESATTTTSNTIADATQD